jgi:EmrB/QacA subfamily drug resistance transporter
MTPERTENKNLALVLLAAAQFIVVLDASIVNVALPSIGRDLHFDEDSLSWVVNAYVLVFGGFLMLGGRLADLIGRRRLFIVGLVLFGVASFFGGLAQNEGQLIAARAIQGLGGALLSPAALSILVNTFKEGSERNRALGVWGAVAGSGGAVGTLLGGVLTDGLGWEWVLFVNTPVCFGVALGSWRVLAESREEQRPRLDIAGAVLVTAGLAVLIYALVDAKDAGWGSTQTIVLLAVSLAMLVGFVVVERTIRAPLVPFGIFRNRTLTGANVTAIFVAMSLFSMFYFITLYMQLVLGFDALKAGLSYIPLSVSIIGAAGVASVLTTRIGYKPVLIAGLLLVAAGLTWFSQISPDGSYVGDVVFPSVLAGLGLGFSFVPVTIASVAGTQPEEAGLASGLINTSQQVGGALGLGILVSIANSRSADVAGSPPVQLTEGFQLAFLTGAGMALFGALLAATLIASRDSRAHRDAARAGDAQPVPV